VQVPGSIINIIEDALNVTLIELTECITVTLRGAGKNFLFVVFQFQQVKNLTGGFGLNNTAGFNKLHRV
jgi:hypothetical protein